MKKLKLKLQNFEGAEMLTREQLKTVMGGSRDGNGGGSGDGTKRSCTATSKCFNWAGTEVGSVSCSSDTGPCDRGDGWVSCEGERDDC